MGMTGGLKKTLNKAREKKRGLGRLFPNRPKPSKKNPSDKQNQSLSALGQSRKG